jgi:hypothetical protein
MSGQAGRSGSRGLQKLASIDHLRTPSDGKFSRIYSLKPAAVTAEQPMRISRIGRL